MSEHFARPASELRIPRIGTLDVAAAPSGGQGLALNEAGAIPPELLGGGSPWQIDIDPVFAKANTNWSTITIAATVWNNGAVTSTLAQDAERTWDVLLAAGTWTVELLINKANNQGIYSVQFDSVEKGTIDGYDAGSLINQRVSVAGIVVAGSGKVELKLKMATKNGASSNYGSSLIAVQLRRTA